VAAEAEDLAAAIAALGLELHGFRGPARAAFGGQPESRRHSLLEDLQPHDAVAGINAPRVLVPVSVVVIVPVVLIV